MSQLCINWLEMHDFGPYSGRHRLEFAPIGKNKPVTLIGGLNGAGKTTFLEALLFVLHGKNAPTQKRSKNSYPNYLAELINRQSGESEAAVTLNFDSIENGRQTNWELTRYVLKKRKTHQDSLVVTIDGEVDEVLAERWPVEVESLWPRHLSGILFFDGERLTELASPEATSAALRSAMKLLLGGLPLVRARDDLRALEKQIVKREDVSQADRDRLTELQGQIRVVQDEVTSLTRELASKRPVLDAEEQKFSRLTSDFEVSGGDLVARVNSLRAEEQSLKSQQAQLDAELKALAGGALPLALLRDQLNELSQSVSTEMRISSDRQFSERVTARDAQVLNWARENSSDTGSDFINDLAAFLSTQRPDVDTESELIHEPGLALHLSELNNRLESDRKKAKELVEKLSQASERLESIERTLKDLPGDDEVILMKENLLKTEATINHLRHEIAELEALRERREGYRQKLEQSEQIAIKKIGKSLEKKNAGARVLEKIPDLVTFFERYEHALLEQSVSEMESRIFECFSRLFNKDQFVSGLKIDPDSFEITLLDLQKEPLGVERLSAGERQMLATSIIWALNQMSENSIPMVIDTPMGRLDGDYRAKFVGEYLPNAANQVVVLSTDEEINENYYPMIEDRIGAEYELRFNPALNSSEIIQGYPYQDRQGKEHETGRVAA